MNNDDANPHGIPRPTIPEHLQKQQFLQDVRDVKERVSRMSRADIENRVSFFKTNEMNELSNTFDVPLTSLHMSQTESTPSYEVASHIYNERLKGK